MTILATTPFHIKKTRKACPLRRWRRQNRLTVKGLAEAVFPKQISRRMEAIRLAEIGAIDFSHPHVAGLKLWLHDRGHDELLAEQSRWFTKRQKRLQRMQEGRGGR